MTCRFLGLCSRGSVLKSFALVAMLLAVQGGMVQCPILMPPTTDLCDGVECPDGETCDADTGMCVADADPCDGVSCPDGQSCNATTGLCEDDPAPAITVTASTDNAAPTVGSTSNLLATVSGGTPPFTFQWTQSAGPAGASLANADQQTAQATFSAASTFTFNVFVADSAGNSAQGSVDVTSSGSAASLVFTLNIDDITATDGDDTLSAPLLLSNNVSTPTLQTGDRADGGAGTDTLEAFLLSTADNTVLPLSLANLEVIQISDFTSGAFSTTVDLTNATALTNLNVVSTTSVPGGDQTIINNIQANVDIGLTSVQSDVSAQFASAASNGSADALDIALAATTATAQLNITTASANGFETINVASGGSAANVLQGLTFTTGTSQATLNISGSQRATILATLDANFTTVNAGTNTGGVDIDADIAQTLTVTGGDGDDLIRTGGNYTTADTLNGGGGTDILGVNSAQANVGTTSQTNVSNFEALMIEDALANATTISSFNIGAAPTLYLPAGSGTFTVTAPTATTVIGGAFFRGTDQIVGNTDSTGNLTLLVQGLGTSDTGIVTLNDHDFGANNIIFSGIETATLNSNIAANGSPADGNQNTAAAVTVTPTAGNSVLNIAGTEDLATSGVVTANTISASTFGAALLMTLNASGATATSSTATTITTGSSNDTVVGSTGGDVINPGTGNNTVQPGRGIDTVSLSSGANIVDLEDLAVAQLTTANRVTVTGFTASGTFSATGGETDALRFGNVTSDGDLSDGAAAAELQEETTPATTKTLNGTAGIIELEWEFSTGVDLDNATDGSLILSAGGAASGTTALTLNVATDDDTFILIAYQDGNAYIYFGDETNDAGVVVAAADMALVAVISGPTPGQFEITNFQ